MGREPHVRIVSHPEMRGYELKFPKGCSETTDLSGENPEILEALEAHLSHWEQEVSQ